LTPVVTFQVSGSPFSSDTMLRASVPPNIAGGSAAEAAVGFAVDGEAGLAGCLSAGLAGSFSAACSSTARDRAHAAIMPVFIVSSP
jgi:hypothetical protein